ncbi:MAG: amidohydrolase [Acidobacteriota bacterium]|nr:MAG: amidohydrolase [Acidobacteriota bacterium]
MAVVFSLFVLVLAGCGSGDRAPVADYIFTNGKIITVNDQLPVVEAVAIQGDRILAVGEVGQIEQFSGPQTRVIDLQGYAMVPGLIEGHTHPISAALAEKDGVIPSIHSFEDIRSHIANVASELPDEELIFVPKVYSTRLKEGRYPDRYELDEMSEGHPVMLDNGYACALNSKALELAEITRNTRDPENGKIIRDQKRTPVGLVLGARQLVSSLLKRRVFTEEDRLWALREMQKAYHKVGITGMVDGAQDAEGLRLYQKLRREGWLTVRTTVTVRVNSEAPIEDVKEEILSIGALSGFGDEMLRIGHLKFALDGGILIGTAYLREPYGENTEVYGFDDAEYRGVLRVSREKTIELVKFANRLGWRVTAHSTGGASTDVLLEAFEEADKEIPIRGRRFSVIHGNFPNPDALARAARLGVVLDMQPAWYSLDGPALSKVLGPERMKTFHPYKSAFDAGVVVAGGADHMIKFDPREAINPFHPFYGMWMVVSRETWDGQVFNPEERVTREQALRMWTINNAYNTFEEDIKGSIEPGKLADFAIISKDYLSCPEAEIKDIETLATIVGGKVMYLADDADFLGLD